MQMLNGSILWGFFSFIFFKVALDASFDHPVAIIGALMLGAMVGFSVFKSTYFYAAKLGKHEALILLGRPSNFLIGAVQIWFATAMVNIFAGKALAFAFSKDLNRLLGNELLFRMDNSYGYRYCDNGLTFAAIITIPVTLHFLAIVYAARSQLALSSKGRAR